MGQLFENLPAEEYHNGIGVGSTMLKDMLESPRKYQLKHILKREPYESDALRFGRIAHMALLEPDKLIGKFVVKPKIDRRTNVGKAAHAEWVAKLAPDAIVMTEDESQDLLGMIESVKEHKRTSSLLKRGKPEVSGYWTHETGQVCRVRPDFLIDDANGFTIVDVKTTRNLDRFYLDAIEYDYPLQAAFYADGIEAITRKPVIFVFLAIEKSAPYEIGLFVADESVRECGKIAYTEALIKLSECKTTNTYSFKNPDFKNMSMSEHEMGKWSRIEDMQPDRLRAIISKAAV
jgi:hypothetical protein